VPPNDGGAAGAGAGEDSSTTHKLQLTDDENNILQSRLKPILVSDSSTSEEEAEDVTDLIDYTLAMLQNGNTSEFVVKELMAMEMEICSQVKAEEIGRAVNVFLEEHTNGTLKESDAQQQEEKSKKNALTMSGALGSGRKGAAAPKPEKTAAGIEPKRNALLMSGALGAPRKGEARPKQDAAEVKSKLEKRKEQKKQKQQQQREPKAGRGGKGGGGGRNNDRETTDSFVYDVEMDDEDERAPSRSRNNNRNDGGRGPGGRGRGRTGRGGRDDGGRTGRGGGWQPPFENRNAGGRGGGRGGRYEQGPQDFDGDHNYNHNNIRKRDIAHDAFDRLSRDHGGDYSGRGNKRQRGGGGREGFHPSRDGGRGRGGRGGRGRGPHPPPPPREYQEEYCDDGYNYGGGEEQDYIPYENGDGYNNYDEGYENSHYDESRGGGSSGAGYREEGGEYQGGGREGRFGGRGGRGRGGFRGGGRWDSDSGGRGRGFQRGGGGRVDDGYNPPRQDRGGRGRGVAPSAARKMTYVRGQGSNANAEGDAGGEESGNVPPSTDEGGADATATNHPSPMVQDTFGGRGGGGHYRGGGRGGRGSGRGRGRGQFFNGGGHHEEVAQKVAQKKWVRQKPDASGGGEESQVATA
jgi:hypothetical protein